MYKADKGSYIEENLAHSLICVGNDPVPRGTKVRFCYQTVLVLSKPGCRHNVLPWNFECSAYTLEFAFN